MPTCAETFANYEEAGFAERLAKEQVHCACEPEHCTWKSPGPVDDGEIIMFMLINPTHFDKDTGTLAPVAFQEVHKRDLSVLREQFVDLGQINQTINEIIDRGASRVPPAERKVDYLARAKVDMIREETLDERRLFAIYDTALPAKRAHASIFADPEVYQSKASQAKARRRLHQIFSSNVISTAKIREQLLAVDANTAT